MRDGDVRLKFADFVLDSGSERVVGPQGPLRLGNKAFCVLLELVREPGRLVTKDELLDRVWGGSAVSESALTTVVKELRRALGDESHTPRFIESVYGRGYRFIAEVAPASTREAAPVVGGPPAARMSRRRALAVGIGGAVAVGAGAAVALWPDRDDAPTGATGIAVLPFANMSGDKAQDYFADGMAEELRSRLARLPGLRVAARTSSSSFRGTGEDVVAIGRKLGVAFVMDGSVRRAGDTIRISAQLVDARNGFARWSQSYDRRFGDIIAVQSDIASECARMVQGQLNGAEATKLNAAATVSAEAFDAYARGRALYDLSGDADTYRSALAAFDRAIELDPRYAPAHAARARTLAALANQFVTADRLRPTYQQGLEAARRAVTLAPDLDEAQSTLGFLLVSGFLDFAGAVSPYERSLRLGGNNADVLIRYGLFATRSGRDRAGLGALNKAVVLDPLNPRAFKALGQGLYAARRYADAIAPMQRALTLSPGMNGAHSVIGDALAMLGRNREARDAYRLEPQGFTRLPGLAIVEARLGDRAAAQAALAELDAGSGDSAAYQRAQVLAQWGDKPGALFALERARRVGDSGLIYLRNDPFLDPLRREPGFADLIRTLNIPG